MTERHIFPVRINNKLHTPRMSVRDLSKKTLHLRCSCLQEWTGPGIELRGAWDHHILAIIDALSKGGLHAVRVRTG